MKMTPADWLIRFYAAPLLLSLAVLSCQAENSQAGALAAQVRDSAGIRILENPRPPDGSRLAWRIGPEPEVSIGERDDEEPYLLSSVTGAMRLPDGRIVVANRSTNDLRFFDALGTHLSTRGGSGEGPGEFQNLQGIRSWPGDSIAAWYGFRAAVSVFDSEGNHGRSFTMADHGETRGFLWRPMATTGDGRVLARWSREEEDTVMVQFRDGEGQVQSSLGTHAGLEPHISPDGYLFGKVFERARVLELWGGLVVIGTTSRYELKAFTHDGTLARVVRLEHEPRPVTDSDVDAYISGLPPMPGQSPQLIRRRYRSVPVAEHFPAFNSIIADGAGHLWVREYNFHDEERPAPLWTVFDVQGQVLGLVETPKDLEIYEIGEDYILGKYRDELGVESVQLWPLDRSGG